MWSFFFSFPFRFEIRLPQKIASRMDLVITPMDKGPMSKLWPKFLVATLKVVFIYFSKTTFQVATKFLSQPR